MSLPTEGSRLVGRGGLLDIEVVFARHSDKESKLSQDNRVTRKVFIDARFAATAARLPSWWSPLF